MGMGALPPNLPTGLSEEDDEIVDVEPHEPSGYTENEDGSVDVLMDELTGDSVESESFDENLAELLDKVVIDRLAADYHELVEGDIKAREKRDQQYAEGIKRTGMGGEAPGGAEFQGASKAVHPMLTKGSVDFASRAIKELFPATGPCKTQIVGDQTEEKLDRAERKKKYMNWQATTQIEENRSELEKLLSQVPLGGAQYKRWWWDFELKRPRTEAVFIDNVFTPYGHSDFYTSPRVTHRQLILRSEYERRIRTGLYRDLDLAEDAYLGMDDESRSQTATNKVEGVDPEEISYNEDGLRVIFQIECQLSLEEDPLLPEGVSAPYVMHVDKTSRRMLGLYRNWREDDDRYRKKHWMTEWPFIPWRDGPAVGLAHIIGSMSGAATGALRAIIDAAQISNFPGGFKLKGGKTSGESITVNATEFAEIDPPPGTDDADIRKLIMAFPFAGPSQVLFNVLEWLTLQGEAVVQTASEKIAEAGNDMPVGTALALIEHGSANFSAIHSRLHAAMKRDLEIQHRLDAEYMDDEETIEDLGEFVAYRKDFQGPMDVIPISDPNIFSETQRFAQLQAVMQLKADPQFVGFFKPDQLLARALKLLQVPDIENIANLPKDAVRLDPLEENYVASSADDARPLKAYESQDHLAHLKMHIQFSTSPMLGANPLIAGGIMPKMLQHCKEHLLFLYKQHTQAAIQTMAMVNQMRGLNMGPDDIQLYGAGFAEQIMAQLLGPMIMPGLQQMQQIVQQISEASKPQPEANVLLIENTKKEIKGMELKAQAEQKNLDRQQQTQAADIAARTEMFQQMAQGDLAKLTTNTQLIITQMNNGSKQLLAEFQAAKAVQADTISQVLAAALAGIQEQVKQAGEDAKNAAATVTRTGSNLGEQLLQPLLAQVQQAMSEALAGMNNTELVNVVTTLASQYQNLEQILAAERQTNAQAIQALAVNMQQLQQRVEEPVEAEIFTDASGRKRARRVRPQQMLPQPQPLPGGA